MFRWLSEKTSNIISWARAILDIINTVHDMFENNNSVESIKELIDHFEDIEWPDGVWDSICDIFPDLVDEYNDMKLSIYNHEHPDG